jgi:hypothetical protein
MDFDPTNGLRHVGNEFVPQLAKRISHQVHGEITPKIEFFSIKSSWPNQYELFESGAIIMLQTHTRFSPDQREYSCHKVPAAL